MIITLLLCRKDKSRYSLMLRSWDIFISTWIILITTGLIWRWLINLAHSSILSTFRALTWSYPELIVSVKCNFSASPIPDCLWLPFYPCEAGCRCRVTGGDLALVAIVMRRRTMDIGVMRSLNMVNIWETMSGLWEYWEARSAERWAGGWAEAKTVWSKETLWAWYHTRPAASDQMIYWASLSTKNRREMSVFWFRPNINTDDGSGQRALSATGQLGAVSIHFKPGASVRCSFWRMFLHCLEK